MNIPISSLFITPRRQILSRLSSEIIIIQDRQWYPLVPGLNHLLHRIFMICPFPEQTTLCFANNQTVQKLNRQFRNKNRPTNVLTFEHPDPESEGGDIILALQTIRKEAQHHKRPCMHHVAHLIIHGLLHLQGYDHAYCNEAREMENRETVLLHKLGIPNPWKHHLSNRST